MTSPKKNADQLVQDLLNGQFVSLSQGSIDDTMKAVKEKVEAEYDIDDEALQKAFKERSEELKAVIGMNLTDEQLQSLTGGKSAGQTAAQVGIGAGAGIGGAVGAIAILGLITVYIK